MEQENDSIRYSQPLPLRNLSEEQIKELNDRSQILVEKEKRRRAEMQIQKEIEEISKLYPSIQSVEDLLTHPSYKRVYDRFRGGVTLKEAFILENIEELRAPAKNDGRISTQNDSPSSQRERQRPLMRFLSWVAMYFCSLIMRYVTYGYLRILSYFEDKLFNLSRTLYIFILMIGGAAAFSIYIYGFTLGGKLMHSWSERICRSKNGTRYVVFGIIIGALYFLSLLSMITGIAEDTSGLQYVWNISMLFFSVAFAIYGKKSVYLSDK